MGGTVELAKQDNRRLGSELGRVTKALRQRLGTQLEATSVEPLRRRIDELTAANNRYRSENVRLATELDVLWRGSVQLRMTLRQYDPVSEE